MSEHWLVVGGGFRGIIGAYLLASKGKKVTLVEAGKFLGGVLSSVPWKDFYLDKGCNLFANDDDLTTSIVMEILGEDVEPMTVRYASIVNGQKTDGMAIPDLGSYGPDAVKNMLYEVLQAATEDESVCASLQDVFQTRYGKTAAQYLASATSKVYRTKPDALSADALKMTLFPRIKFLEDDLGKILKLHPKLDWRIAVSSQHDPMMFYRDQATEFPHRNFYPKHRGLRQFCENAAQKLSELGVNILLECPAKQLDLDQKHIHLNLENGDTLSADRLLWTADITLFETLTGLPQKLDQFIHRVPMVLYYFIIRKAQEGPYTYVHHFDEASLWFRSSTPGGYVEAAACPPGQSYVCCEATTEVGSELWENPEPFADIIWQELMQHNIVKGEKPLDLLQVKVSSTYKLPKLGYWETVENVVASAEQDQRIVGVSQWEFSKNSITRALHETLEAI